MNFRYHALPMRVVFGAGSLSRLPDEAGDLQAVARTAHIEVGPGRELCATSTGGTAFVLWHAVEWERPSLWALQ